VEEQPITKQFSSKSQKIFFILQYYPKQGYKTGKNPDGCPVVAATPSVRQVFLYVSLTEQRSGTVVRGFPQSDLPGGHAVSKLLTVNFLQINYSP
jgi:hypothetical protein